MCRFPVLETEFLSKPSEGIVSRTTYYSDGSVETTEIHKYTPVKYLVPLIRIN